MTIHIKTFFPALYTASPDSGTISGYDVIKFKYIKTSHGINNLSSIKNNGIFTVEKEGFYLNSRFVNSKTYDAEFYIRQNTNNIASATTHGDSALETHAATVIAHLKVGDTVSVMPRSHMYVDSAPDSMLTVVQII